MLSSIRNLAKHDGFAGWMYGNKTFFKTEIQSLFYKKWLFAGHSCDIPLKGDWTTLQVGDYPILLTRGSDGNVRGFHNVCRHRGMKVCEGSGNTKKMHVCPYHQWSYDKDTGELRFARDLPKDVDRYTLGLKLVAVETVGGLIFASVAKEPPCFEETRELVDKYLSPFDLENAKVAYESHITKNANWKLLWENNRECYPENSKSDTVDVQFMGECADLGQYKRNLEGNCSVVPIQSTTGEPAVRFGSPYLGDLLFYHYPSMWGYFTPNYCVTFRISPVSATKTKLVTTWLVPGNAVLGEDYCMNTLTKVWLERNRENKESVERVQMGVTSPAYTPGSVGVTDFLGWHHRMMGGYGQC
jgi:phenylpropionate dioxygenase-like ring-hydroxylating dioxygenase large terminal subunit